MIDKLMYWAIIIFVGLFGIFIVYKIARIIIIIFLPDIDNKIEVRFILSNAKKYFGFLLKRGYRINDLKYVAGYKGGWHFRLESPDNNLSIILDEEVGTHLIFGNEENRLEISLQAMIYYLNKTTTIFSANSYRYTLFASKRKRLQETAELVKVYIGQFESCLNGDFEKLKVELENVKKEYAKLYNAEFTKWFNSKKKDSTFS